MSEERSVRQQVRLATTPDLAFEAVTKDSELREWFCDFAWTEVRPDGRFEVRWHRGYRAEGRFVGVDLPRWAAVTWQGTAEPGETRVQFLVEDAGSGEVMVTVVQSGFGPREQWDQAVGEAEKGWKLGLENLKSTLETGVDLRLSRQPFLGIWFDAITPELVAKEGLAVDKGIYIQGTADGSGAEAAGIQKGDVLLAVDGEETADFNVLGRILRAHQAGDEIEAQVVRGQELLALPITLGQRPTEEVSDTATGMADLVAQRQALTRPELEAVLEGITEQEASEVPEGGGWSVKQVLAHLSVCERDYQNSLATIALDGFFDSGDGNTTAMEGRLAAVLATTPTIAGLVERFYVDQDEMVSFFRGLPEETLRHKARFYRMGQYVGGLHPGHTRDHIEQIKQVLATVRGE
jgi:uncharacterized protein YndB with AHSA1/START domain